MKKLLLPALILGAVVFPHNPAHADTTCDIAKELLTCIDNAANISFTTADSYQALGETCASQFPAMMAMQARNMMQTYGYMFYELYSNMRSPEQIATETGLCSDGPACSTCDFGNEASTPVSIDNGIRTTTRAYGYCVTGCTCPTPCPDRVTYSCSCYSGYEVFRQGSSDCFCAKKYCEAGQYLNASNNCVPCPTVAGFTPTSEAWSLAITACYIPKDSASTNSKGGYQYSDNCYYTL